MQQVALLARSGPPQPLLSTRPITTSCRYCSTFSSHRHSNLFSAQGSSLPSKHEDSGADGLVDGCAAVALQQSDVLEPGSRSGSPAVESVQRQNVKRRQKPPAAPSLSHPRQPSSKTSKYKGVSWSERSSKWRVQVWFGNKVHCQIWTHNGTLVRMPVRQFFDLDRAQKFWWSQSLCHVQVHHLGFFACEEAAARCYDTAVLELRGPSAATNFTPEEGDRADNPLKPSILQNMAATSLPK